SDSPQSDDPIIDFVERYDIKHDYFGLQVGFISFKKQTETFEDEGQSKIHFADTPYELVVIDVESARVELIDHGGSAYPLPIAKSSAHFLEALLHLKALGKYSSTLNKAVEQEVLKSYATKAAIAAGDPSDFATYGYLSGIGLPLE
ncbi:MAG: hypothetical protein AAF696_19020, partial [Bacteroidota bacterium]